MSRHPLRLFGFLLLAVFVVVGGVLARPHTTEPAPVELTFAVYTSDKATVMYRMFTPIIEALQERMEVQLERPVEIDLKIFKGYEGAIDALVKGEVDFVRFGASPYVIAKGQNDKIELLAMESKKGKKRFKGAIVVAADSSLRTLSDLRGKRFAFGDERSTVGRVLSQGILLEAGVRGSDLEEYAYLGRHDKVVQSVMIGDYDAGAAKMSTVKKVDKSKKLRVLHDFEVVTKPWVARAGLDAVIVDQLRAGLLSLDSPEALKQLKITGFLSSDDKEYDSIRKALEATERFDPKANRDSAKR
ncbi:MAG: PhnD/SsuA/transferrin family substrate-binding protein [Planctomycetota bacterium]